MLGLASIGMPGCMLRTSIDAHAFMQAQGIRTKGWARLEATIPHDPRLRGATSCSRWLSFGADTAGPYGAKTRALVVTIQ